MKTRLNKRTSKREVASIVYASQAAHLHFLTLRCSPDAGKLPSQMLLYMSTIVWDVALSSPTER
jgi:hypothetical protein